MISQKNIYINVRDVNFGYLTVNRQYYFEL